MSAEEQAAGTATPNLPDKISYKGIGMDNANGGGSLVAQTFGEVVAFAQVMATANVALPAFLRGNAGACLAVCMQAMRWEMDPFMVANKTYSVNDRLAYEAQLVNAVVLTRAPIIGRPIYEFSGEGPTRRCKVTFTMKEGRQELEYETPLFKDITTKNSPLWKSDPDQQLGYFAVRSWARRHTPEVLLGVYTPDEMQEVRDVTPRGEGTGLAARLAEQATPTEGFSPGVVDAAMAEPVQDAEFSERLQDVAEAIGEALAKPVPETPEEPAGEPEIEAPVEDEAAGPDVLLSDITEDNKPGALAWAQVFMATGLKKQTPADLMSLWRFHFESRITPLKAMFPEVYDSLEAWMERRMKTLREPKA